MLWISFCLCFSMFFACLVCLFLLCFMWRYTVVLLMFWLFLFFLVFMVWCACVFVVGLKQAVLLVGCAVMLLSIMLWSIWVYDLSGTQEVLALRLLIRYLLFWFGFFLVVVAFESLELGNTYFSKGRVHRLFSAHSPPDMFALEFSNKHKCNDSRFQGQSLRTCFGMNQNAYFQEFQAKLRVNRLATYGLTDCPCVLVVFDQVRWTIY